MGASASASVPNAAPEVVHETPSILAESEHWMALYKPPFWMVNVDSKEAAKAATIGPYDEEDEGEMDDSTGAEETRKRPRMQAWVQQREAVQRPIHSDPQEAFGLLHRLDVQTSGIIMCAKSYVGAYWLRLQWCSYAVDKEYVCLVHGWVDKNLKEIHKRIRVDKKKAPNSRRTISTHCSISESGKPSFTELVTIAHLTASNIDDTPRTNDTEGVTEGKYSLVSLKLHTGRTHQIRVHMLSAGHPLVCDIKYAEDKFPRDRAWCPRNFLHTYRLAFDDVPASVFTEARDDSSDKRAIEVFCPLPRDLTDTLQKLSPVDEISEKNVSDWLSRDIKRMKKFEQYQSDAGSNASVSESSESRMD